MKRILVAAALMGLGGGVHAADFGALADLHPAGINSLLVAKGIPAPDASIAPASANSNKVEYQYGEKVILVNEDNRAFTLVTYVGINSVGEAVINFPIGESYSRRMTVPFENLAKTSGCATDGFCVEQEALYILESFRPTSYRAGRIAGIRTDGKVILQSISGGLILHNIIDTEDLAHPKGCNDAGYCVGETVLAPGRINGEIIGVFKDNTLVVRVDDPFFVVAKRYSSTQLVRPYNGKTMVECDGSIHLDQANQAVVEVVLR